MGLWMDGWVSECEERFCFSYLKWNKNKHENGNCELEWASHSLMVILLVLVLVLRVKFHGWVDSRLMSISFWLLNLKIGFKFEVMIMTLLPYHYIFIRISKFPSPCIYIHRVVNWLTNAQFKFKFQYTPANLKHDDKNFQVFPIYPFIASFFYSFSLLAIIS